MPRFNRGKYAYRVEEVREEFLEENGVVSTKRVHVCTITPHPTGDPTHVDMWACRRMHSRTPIRLTTANMTLNNLARRNNQFQGGVCLIRIFGGYQVSRLLECMLGFPLHLWFCFRMPHELYQGRN